MRAVLLAFVVVFTPRLTLADPQCILPGAIHIPAADTTRPRLAAAPSLLSQTALQPAEPGVAPADALTSTTGASALEHVVAAGAQITQAGISHGLRTVVARNDGQFMRIHLSPDGQVLVAGLMAELSPADLVTMAPGQVTELGSLHGLRGLFVRNAGQFQVFYVTLDGERVIPGAMFDARGKNLTQDQVASIPGAIPTVVIGNAANPALQAQTPAGMLLKAVEPTTYGTTGVPTAPRLWVFIDPRCGWSVRAMGQLRPYVASGRVQLAVIPVSVLDHEDQGRSTVAAKAMLSLSPDAMISAWTSNKLGEQAESAADQRLATNMAAVAAIGLRGTPTFVWRKTDGTEGRADGLPDDVDALIASIGR